jgi:hypothetical protein
MDLCYVIRHLKLRICLGSEGYRALMPWINSMSAVDIKTCMFHDKTNPYYGHVCFEGFAAVT